MFPERRFLVVEFDFHPRPRSGFFFFFFFFFKEFQRKGRLRLFARAFVADMPRSSSTVSFRK